MSGTKGQPRRTRQQKLKLKNDVFALHADRMKNEEIATTLKISEQYVYQIIKEMYQETSKPLVERELKRDLGLIESIIKQARRAYHLQGDPAQAAIVDKMIDKKAKILSYYAPTEISVSGQIHHVQPEDVELYQMITEQKARNALQEQELKAEE